MSLDLLAINQRADHLIGLTICEANATRIAFDMARELAGVQALCEEIERLRDRLERVADLAADVRKARAFVAGDVEMVPASYLSAIVALARNGGDHG